MKAKIQYFWICGKCRSHSKKTWTYKTPAYLASKMHLFRTGHVAILGVYSISGGIHPVGTVITKMGSTGPYITKAQ